MTAARSVREYAYEIGRTTRFTETDAMTAAALISEDYPDQREAVRVMDAVQHLAFVQHRTMAATAVDLLPYLRGEVIAA